MIVFPFYGFEIVAKEPMLVGSRPEFTKLAFAVADRCFWFLDFLHPNIRSNWVLFSICTGVDDGGVGGRLEAFL